MTRQAVSPLALVVCAVCMWSSGVALAKPKVALTQIEGDTTGDVRDAVAEALEDGKDLALISGKEVNRAVDKLGDLADLTEKDFKKLAIQLEADAIVMGKLDKIGGSKTLKFKLFVHKKMAKGFTVSFKDAKSEKFRTLLHDKMLDKIGAGAGPDAEPEDDRPGRKKKTVDDEEDPADAKAARAKKAKKARLADDEDEAQPRKARPEDEDDKPAPADDEAAGKADDDEPRRSRKKVAASEDGEDVEAGVSASVERPRTANHVAIRLDAGVSLIQRSFTFSTTIAGNPKNVSLSPVPGVRVAAEAYPLGLNNPRSALAGLGLAAEYDKTVKLNVTTMGMTAPVKQSHYSFGLRYRLAFGKTETSPTLTLGVGYGKRLFSPDRSKVTDDEARADLLRNTPTTQYVVIDPGASVRLPVTRMVAFVVDGRGLIITNAGPIQGLGSYGQAKVYGVEAAAGVDIVLGKRFAVRLAGEFAQIGFAFTGAGDLSNNLDNDPTTKDVGGMLDRSIGGSATLAVLY